MNKYIREAGDGAPKELKLFNLSNEMTSKYGRISGDDI